MNPTQGGYGIQATVTTRDKAGLNYRLQAISGAANGTYNNKFYNLAEAINSNSYFEHNIQYCDVRSSSHSSSGAPAMTLATIGNYGFYISTNRYRQIEILNNSLYNIGNAITFNAVYGPFAVGSATSSNGQYSGQVDINKNTIQPHLTGYPITSQYVANAIIAQTVVSAGLLPLPSTVININNNNISKVYRGIYCANWQKKNIINSTNTITLSNDPYFPTNPTQFGISHANNIGLTTNGNNIFDNTITGSNITNPNMHGIYTSLSHNQFLHCNSTSTTYNGVSFNGSETATQNLANSMSNHYYGFVLNNNAIIGTQGAVNAPIDDRWNGAWIVPHYKTATLGGSSATTSNMYVRNSGGVYNPNGSGISTTAPVALNDYYYSGSSGTILYGTGATATCPVVPPNNNPSTLRTLLEQIVLDLVPVVNNVAQTRFIAKNQVFRTIKNDTSIMAGSTVLRTFYNQSQSTSKQAFYSADSSLVNLDVATAQSKVNSVVPQNGIETNYKNFYSVYINYQGDSTISVSDSSSLINLANGCPFTDGAAVYMARAMYNAVYQNAQYFPDNCPNTLVSSRVSSGIDENNELINIRSFDALLYPNPNENGNVYIATQGLMQGNIRIKLTNIEGRVIYDSNLNVNEGITGFSLTDIKNGIYFVQIYNLSTGEQVVKKLTIQY